MNFNVPRDRLCVAARLIGLFGGAPPPPISPAPARPSRIPVYAKWADAYKKETGVGLNYQSIGSGGGIKQIQARTVTFGATDAPLEGDELTRAASCSSRWSWAASCRSSISTASPPAQLDARRPDAGQDLPRQDQDLGRPGDQGAQSERSSCRRRRSPSCTVRTVRAPPSTSPTTSPRSAPDWKAKVGVGTAVEWPVGIGAKGNEGVANNVAQTNGSIGYVEYAYAKQNKLNYTKNDQQATARPSLRPSKLSRPLPPMPTGRTVPGFWRHPDRPARRRVVADDGGDLHPDPQAAEGSGRRRRGAQVLRLGLRQGGKMAEELDYVPMPAAVVALDREDWANDIKDAAGKPLYTASH